MNRLLVLSLFSLLLIINSNLPVQAQKLPKRLNPFEGEWISSGPAFGVPAQSTMRWSSALDGRFSRLDYRIEMHTGEDPKTREETTAIFEGVAYYQFKGAYKLRAFWADNSGDLHPITADWEGDALISDWGVAGKKQGRTRYELIRYDEMEVTDWIKTGEGWRQFNHNVFKLQPKEDQ